MKTCSTCKQTKPLSEFSTTPHNNDGYHYSCKPCRSQYMKDLYRRNPEYRERCRQNRREYSAKTRERFREYQREYQKKYQAKRRLKRDARNAVTHAIERGELPRAATLNCVYPACQVRADAYHHHNGYAPDHWLDVVPLCSLHHTMTRSNYVS